MTAASRTLKELFLAALEVAPEERDEWLARECAANAALREQLSLMLAAHDAPQSLLDRPGKFLPASPAVDLEATAAKPTPEKPGTQIGPYKLLQEIGEGGMGTVYMAEQSEPVRRRVALKIIKLGMDSRAVVARFEAERQALSLMDHPHIAKVLDAGTTDSGRPYFVMELVKGTPITQYADEHQLTPGQRLELFLPVCQAIQHAHQKGIIHRDIKPSNVLVADYDDLPVVKVIDFGIAKATGQPLTEKTLFTEFGAVVGTLEYMSPEQARLNNHDIDTRSDVYSLGVLLYELLTGTTPLNRQSLKQAAFTEMLRIIREDEPPKPSTRLSDLSNPQAPLEARGLPGARPSLASVSALRHTEPAKLTKMVRGELDWIVMRALEKDRNRRYETANGLAMDVQRYLRDEPVLACPPSVGYRLRKLMRRNKVALATVALVMAALVVGAGVASWQAVRATTAQGLAQERLKNEQAAREEATANLRKAREAGDQFFSHISESTILDEPGLEPLRRQLLETAVGYYEGLIPQSGNDLKVQVDVVLARLRLAQVYFHVGDREQYVSALNQALDLVEKFIQENPEASDLHLRLAGFWHGGRGLSIVQREWKEQPALETHRRAAACWERLTERYPEAIGFQSDLSKFYDLLGMLEQEVGSQDDCLRIRRKVCELREKIVRDTPGVYENAAELGHAYVSLGRALEETDPAEAEKLYRQAIALQKDTPNVSAYQQFLASHHWELGRFLRQQGRPEEALPWYLEAIAVREKLAEQFPHVSVYRTRVEQLKREAENLQRRIGHGSKQPPPAKSPAEQEALALFEGLNSDGDAYRAANEPQKAENAYRMTITRFKELPHELSQVAGCRKSLMHAYARLGDLLAENEPPEGAERAYREALEVAKSLASDFPGVRVYRNRLANMHRALGRLYLRVGRAVEAEQAFGEAVGVLEMLTAEFPHEDGHWYNLGLVHARLGKWDQAIANQTQAIALNPDHWQAWYALGLAHAQLKQWERVVADHTKSIELKPDFAEAWHMRGVAHGHLGQWEKALADQIRASELNPDYGDMWHWRGWAYANLGKWDAALPEYTRQLELAPKNKWGWWRRAQAHSALRHWDQAIADYAKAIELGITEPDIWLSKAAAHASLEQWDEAIAELKQAFAQGFRNVQSLRNREDLAALREREDFKNLLTELKAKNE